MTRNTVVFPILVVLLLGGGATFAQTNAEVNAGIQFNFSTPGARSLGLGGAFVGLADDATAAFTNPAGLTILNQPEVSLEGRTWSYTHEVPYRGHIFGPPSSNDPANFDSVAGIRTREFQDDVSAPSFASFVYPRGRWAIAVYRHVLADFEAQIENQGPYFEVPDAARNPFRFLPIRANLNLEIVNYGVSGAYRLTEGLSVGVGAAYYEFDLDSVTRRFELQNPLPTGPGGFFGPPDFSEDNVRNFQELVGAEEDVAGLLGILWDVSPGWSLGAVYRQGPSFEFTTRNVAGPATPDPGFEFNSKRGEFHVPDVYALGLAYRATDSLTLTFDYDRIEYSDLTDDVVEIFFAEDSPDAPARRAAAQRLVIDDADELHFGLEYVWVKPRYPVALRLGSYYDPDHKVAFEGQPDGSRAERATAALFQPGDDEFHYSAGLGVVFGAFQVDAAADFSDLLETFSLSGVYRF